MHRYHFRREDHNLVGTLALIIICSIFTFINSKKNEINGTKTRAMRTKETYKQSNL